MYYLEFVPNVEEYTFTNVASRNVFFLCSDGALGSHKQLNQCRPLHIENVNDDPNLQCTMPETHCSVIILLQIMHECK